jgi:arsenate reductase
MARKVTVYQYPTCDTCRKAVSYLKKLGNEPELRNIKSDPPGESELAAMIAASGLPVDKWFNTSGEQYRRLGLKDKLAGLSDAEKIRLLSGNGMLIKRPIVYDGNRATVGFKEDRYDEVWKK